ncbi:MAG: TetR/AcrR family transcriptional regulator [Lachnospiraceae bacterium]|nr:TetR/AcrR family transcriptional regulator [Lachnospiraceae bacterium]
MGRKTKITKEMILEAAYELLDESGIGAVGIKSIASKLGCSTQPVSWQFGSMTELRKELYEYAAMKLYGTLGEEMRDKEALEAFFVSGKHYLSGACDHPNVFRFVNVDDPLETIGEQLYEGRSIFDLQFDKEAFEKLTAQYDVSPEAAGEAVRDVVIYTHGLAVMMMFDSYRLPKDEAVKMMYNMGVRLLADIGIHDDTRRNMF